MKRLVLDVDGVVSNFVEGFLAYASESGGYAGMPCCWRAVDRYEFFPQNLWEQIRTDSVFWLNLRRMPGVRQKMISHGIFPDLYLTARPVRSYITARWISDNLLPTAEVMTVERPLDKMQFLQEGDVFVDDHPATVRAAQERGVTALLMDAPFHVGESNESLDGLAVIKCVSEVAQFLN